MKRLFLKSIFIFISLFFINIRAVFPFNSTFDSIIKIDTITKSNDLLLDKISYEASDTVSINHKNKTIRLYNNAKINYQDMQITAGIIIVDYNKNEIYAGRIKDSSGIYTQLPVFVQGNDEVNPDSLKFLPGRKVSNAGSFEISKKDNFNNILVKNILSINGVESIFLGSDFVSINKNKDIDWEDIKHIVISFINEFYEGGNEYIINHSKNENEDENLDEIEKKNNTCSRNQS